MSKKPKLLPALSYLQPRITLSRWTALIGYLGLILVMLGYNLLYADMHGANPVIIIAVQLLPLSIFLPGILIGHVRTHAWLCFAINLYFIQGVLICFQPGRLNYGLLMSGLSVVYFIAALYFIRWSFQAQRVRAGEPSN